VLGIAALVHQFARFYAEGFREAANRPRMSVPLPMLYSIYGVVSYARFVC
jgi:hypothetical protein